METVKKLHLLQQFYAGVIADAVLQFEKEGVLKNVIERKRKEQMERGALKAAQLGITTTENVFQNLSQIFGCANWTINSEKQGFTAEAKSCLLCGFAKKMGAPSPCNLYCLDPMEGMVKGLSENAVFCVEKTLWDSDRCRVNVKS